MGMTDWIAVLGEHFSLVAIGCIEVAVAVILISTGIIRRIRREKKIDTGNVEQAFIRKLDRQDDDVFILMRRKDRLPVYVAGDLKGMFGESLERLQEDVTCLQEQMMNKSEAKKVWREYCSWDGTTPFFTEAQMKNGQWLCMTVYADEENKYDLIRLEKSTRTHKQLERYEEELAQAEEASQSKTSFLYRMSHEIRTPMNGIMGMLKLAKEKLNPEHPAVQYLDKVEELSDHLLALINDILDMSRIEAGKVELEEKTFSLRTLGNKLYDMFAKNLESRGIRYEVNFEDMTVDSVIGDELRISQVIINFLSNAVKFTQQGEITVTFRQMMLHDGKADLMIGVHDTGIGMEPEFINRIFRPFEQEGADTARKYGGTGLGMAITDQLVKLMGGEIVVKSVPGQGSDFTVFITLPEAAEQIAQSTEAKREEQIFEQDDNAFAGRRILLAEDNEINAMIAEEILGDMGAGVDVAENGQIAVEKFAEHPEGYYDFILMDVQMPVMNGREAARKIRAMKRADAKEILIFALSADAFIEDERQSVESGMNGHYAKPVDFDALQSSIGAILREKERV